MVVDYVMPVLNGIETIASFTSEMLQNTKVSHVCLVDIRFYRVRSGLLAQRNPTRRGWSSSPGGSGSDILQEDAARLS